MILDMEKNVLREIVGKAERRTFSILAMPGCCGIVPFDWSH